MGIEKDKRKFIESHKDKPTAKIEADLLHDTPYGGEDAPQRRWAEEIVQQREAEAGSVEAPRTERQKQFDAELDALSLEQLKGRAGRYPFNWQKVRVGERIAEQESARDGRDKRNRRAISLGIFLVAAMALLWSILS